MAEVRGAVREGGCGRTRESGVVGVAEGLALKERRLPSPGCVSPSPPSPQDLVQRGIGRVIPITRPPAGWHRSGDPTSLGRPYSSSPFGRPLPFWEFPPPKSFDPHRRPALGGTRSSARFLWYPRKNRRCCGSLRCAKRAVLLCVRKDAECAARPAVALRATGRLPRRVSCHCLLRQ